MTPDDMRVAIAEKCGVWWNEETIYIKDSRYCRYHPRSGLDLLFEVLPDYPADLNAMHSAFMEYGKSKPGFFTLFESQLEKVSWRRQTPIWALEAKHYAEAFCRVFWPERWQDGAK